MDVNGKTVIVAGLGISGRSMMQVLKPRAGKVIGVDEKQPDADLHSFDQIHVRRSSLRRSAVASP